jgi:hypothetical protein
MVTIGRIMVTVGRVMVTIGRGHHPVLMSAGDPIGHVKLIGIVAFYKLLTVNLTCFFPVSKTLP